MYSKLKQAMRDTGIQVTDGHVLTVPDQVLVRDFFHFSGKTFADFVSKSAPVPPAVATEPDMQTSSNTEQSEDKDPDNIPAGESEIPPQGSTESTTEEN